MTKNPLRRIAQLFATAWLVGCGPDVDTPRETSAAGPVCAPVDSAWAIALRVVDGATGKPVTDALASVGLIGSMTVTDSAGWGCIRNLAQQAETLQLSRPGYREASIVLAGKPGDVVRHEVLYERVERPCCDLRGRWHITFHLETPAERHPNPAWRTVSGELSLGPRYHPPEDGDDQDSLVRVVRGLHEVDFTPFFEGPVARDVSTSIYGSGPDLLREVMATIPSSDDVEVVFIPRMSHGSLSLSGRIRDDTIRGSWVQNAFCCGARGRFEMRRIAADTTPFPAAPSPGAGASRARRAFDVPPLVTAGGEVPGGRWRPELAVAPDGRFWLANGGLFVADSIPGPWRRVLGGPADPVEADDLRIGLAIAFVSERTIIIGLDWRFPLTGAPSVYRTENGGVSWSGIPMADVQHVEALAAIGPSVWLATRSGDGSASGFARSEDGGRTWTPTALPPTLDGITGMHRPSLSIAYLRTTSDSVNPALWRTMDGGGTWAPVPTPHDQGLQRLDDNDTRVEQIATVGEWLLVREHGKVFVSPSGSINWRPLPGVREIASETGGDNVFVLTDSLYPALLDRNLRTIWRGTQRLPIDDPSNIEQVVFRRGVGYVSETNSTIHEVSRARSRVVRKRG